MSENRKQNIFTQNLNKPTKKSTKHFQEAATKNLKLKAARRQNSQFDEIIKLFKFIDFLPSYMLHQLKHFFLHLQTVAKTY